MSWRVARMSYDHEVRATREHHVVRCGLGRGARSKGDEGEQYRKAKPACDGAASGERGFAPLCVGAPRVRNCGDEPSNVLAADISREREAEGPKPDGPRSNVKSQNAPACRLRADCVPKFVQEYDRKPTCEQKHPTPKCVRFVVCINAKNQDDGEDRQARRERRDQGANNSF